MNKLKLDLSSLSELDTEQLTNIKGGAKASDCRNCLTDCCSDETTGPIGPSMTDCTYCEKY